MHLIKVLPFCCKIQRRLFPEVQVNAFDLSPKKFIYFECLEKIINKNLLACKDNSFLSLKSGEK